MKKIIIPLAIIASFLISCSDLDIQPRSTITNSVYWKQPSDFQAACNELFFGLDYFPTDSYAETMSGSSLNSVSDSKYQPSDNDGTWNNSYAYIRLINTILQNYDACDIKQQAAASKGEALFFRAYNYFNLYKKFGAVPIVKTVLDVDSPELMGPRSPKKDVEDFILADLDSACLFLPETVTSSDRGRITKTAALAFKSRVALYIGTWAKYHNERTDYIQILKTAADAAEKVISSTKPAYKLYTGKGLNSYRYLFIEEGDDSSESILDNRFYFNIRTHGNTYGYAWGTAGFPTKKLADTYLCDDGLPIEKSARFQGYSTVTSEYQNRDPRMAMTLIVPGSAILTSEVTSPFVPALSFSARPETKSGYRFYKFIGEKYYSKVGSGLCEYDCRILRLGEILLNYIEASYEANGSVTDAELDKTINALRKRVGFNVALTNQFVATHGLNMLTEIRRERTVELANEGFRFDDLRRWKTAETEMSQALRGVKITGTEWEHKINISKLVLDSEGFVLLEPASERTFTSPKNYLFPLPLQQMQMNPNLKPNNPGWD
jgi:hypothetical protein